MTLTVRLPEDLDAQFAAACERRRVGKSEAIIRMARDFVAAHPERSAYDVALELGIAGAAVGEAADLSVTTKQRVREAIRAKHRR
jgi:hypothetical protein